jgi:hypothetical protein
MTWSLTAAARYLARFLDVPGYELILESPEAR